MNAKPLKTAYELEDMIVEQAMAIHGPWPAGMTLFIFDDAYGWTASISRPNSEADNVYRACTLDLIARLTTKYDLDVPRLSHDLSDLAFSNPGAADLKSPTRQRQNRVQGFQIESGTRIGDLPVPMTFRNPRKDVAAMMRGLRKAGTGFDLRDPQTPRRSTWQKASKEAIGKPRNPKRRRPR
jgi:hypothetical protein